MKGVTKGGSVPFDAVVVGTVGVPFDAVVVGTVDVPDAMLVVVVILPT